jgi:hypothetical protein
MVMNTEASTDRSSSARPGTRRTVATYSTYAEAQRAVDYLSDQKFPVEHVAIVAEGLRIVEQVTGRLTYGRAALNGALTGAVIGGFFGFFFGLFSFIAPLISALALALYGMLYGAAVGALLNMLFHALSGGERDFSSVGGVLAERYDVVVDEAYADEAARLVAQLGGQRQPHTPSTGPQPQPA